MLEYPLAEPVTVYYKTRANTATANVDYKAIPPTRLTFLPGVTVITATVEIINDLLDENTEQLYVDLLNNSSNTDLMGGLGQNKAIFNIVDDDPPPFVQFNDLPYSVVEGTDQAVITLTLSTVSGRDVTTNYATADNSAVAGFDYVSTTGSVLFPTGSALITFSVPIIDDTRDEFDENLRAGITVPPNGGDPTAVVTGSNPITLTIIDNDPAPTLAISNNLVIEGDTGATVDMPFQVWLSTVSEKPATVTYATADNTATTAGNDYTPTGGTLVFVPLDISKTVTVTVLGDSIDEFTETFSVILSSPINATTAVTAGTGIILDDDPLATASITDTIVTEGDSGTVSAVFTVALSGQSEKPMTILYTTADNTAVDDGSDLADYNAVSGALNLTLAPATAAISVEVNGDTMYEQPDPETFFVNLTGSTNALISNGQGVGAIRNDDPRPTLSISDTSVTETTGVTTTAIFTVTLSNPAYQNITVNYRTQNDTAAAPDDFTAINAGLLTFLPGVVAQPIPIVIEGDAIDEFDETFTVTLSSPVNATIAVTDAVGTILDDDGLPTVQFSDAVYAVDENINTGQAVITVTLSAVSGRAVTVTYSTADGTASNTKDYTTRTGQLIFPPGATSLNFTVPITNDNLDEFKETVKLSLSGEVNAVLGATSIALLTIIDDDPPPDVSISPIITVTEGDTGSVNAVLTVTLSTVSGKPITVTYGTANNTATTGGPFGDYTHIPATTTLNFAPGQITTTIIAVIHSDTIYEPDETFYVNLITPTHVTIAAGQGTVIIANDDFQPTLSINDTKVTEGNAGFTTIAKFTISLSNLSYQSVQVNYATADNSAVAPDDYTSVPSTTLTFAPFEQTKIVNVTVQGDDLDEFNETFFVNLSNPISATITAIPGVGTIQNDDPQPSLSISDIIVSEAAGHALFTVTLSAASGKPITVTYATADDTATTIAGDYVGSGPAQLVFAPGETTKLITITINEDLLDEIEETFFINLSGEVNATLVDGQGVGTILDNDPLPTVQFSKATDSKSESAGSAAIEVTLTPVSGRVVTVTYATTVSGTATAGSDYTPVGPAQLVFNPGQTNRTFTIPSIDDSITNEPNETVVVELNNPANATLGVTSVTTLTIVDNDKATVQFSSPAYNINENDSTGQATITVNLNAESAQPVTVTYTTADGTATTADGDYTAGSGLLNFPIGLTTLNFTVSITDDSKNEDDETVNLTLSGSVNATAGGPATLKIKDNDPLPSLSISDTSASEGAGSALFTVTLSAVSGRTVSVKFKTADNSAIAPDDYIAIGLTPLIFPPGTVSQTVFVSINNDALNEINESFFVDLSNEVNATIAAPRGTGTITDDDAPPDLKIKKISPAITITTGNLLTYTITITNPGPSTATNVVLTDTTNPVNKISLISAPDICTNSTSGPNFIVACNIGILTPGAMITTIVFTVTGTGGTIDNTANVTSAGPDPDTSNNTVSLFVGIN